MASVSVGGAELFYREAGSGPPLLLIHGSGPDADDWGEAFDDLARDHRVIAYDRRGFSRSTGEPSADWHRHGQDAAALLERLDAAPAHVAGWSAGGFVALDLVLNHRALMRSLVLVETPLYGRKRPTLGLIRTFLKAARLRRRTGDRGAAEAWFRFITGYRDGGSTWDRPDYPAERKETLLANASAMLTEMQSRDTHLTRERVSAIDCPVTVVLGGRSQSWFDKTARNTAELIDGAELRVIEDSNHAFGWEQPHALAAAIRAGAARASTPGAAA
jgi:pimeloyl-ACP methyl ester carboxylesterase